MDNEGNINEMASTTNNLIKQWQKINESSNAIETNQINKKVNIETNDNTDNKITNSIITK